MSKTDRYTYYMTFRAGSMEGMTHLDNLCAELRKRNICYAIEPITVYGIKGYEVSWFIYRSKPERKRRMWRHQ